jgi:glycosyltransferase involved in cell wall biosynthesis
MKLSLIITTYNWPEALSLVIKSINNQTILPDEVIIADDGSTQETKDLITRLNNSSDINIIHAWQEDIGYRAARSRNNGILKASGDYIVLIDGDMILHANFIQDHILSAEHGFFVQGSRVLLSKEKSKNTLSEKIINFSIFSNGLKNRKNLIHSKLLSKIFSNKKNQHKGTKTCNLAFYRQDCINVNGFNNDFEDWGREDSEFVVRLMNSGVNRKRIRFSAIQFHLWHNENSRMSLKRNDTMLNDAINNRIHWCENGINSIEKNES